MYNPPKTVISPQASVANVRPIYDGGDGQWSVALLFWEGEPALGIRWNGQSIAGKTAPHPGHPNSRGLSTWFIIPDPLVPAVLLALKAHGLGGASIDKNEATKWVDRELQDRKITTESTSAIANDALARQVIEIVMEMKRAGNI